jgi:hypothetical protein
MKIRILHFKSGTSGYLYLTKHFDSDSDDFGTQGFHLDEDKIVTLEPFYDGLPMETILKY